MNEPPMDDRRAKLGDDTFRALLAFEEALATIHDSVTSAELARVASLTPNQVATSCRWLMREGYVRHAGVEGNKNHWGLTDLGLELLRDSE